MLSRLNTIISPKLVLGENKSHVMGQPWGRGTGYGQKMTSEMALGGLGLRLMEWPGAMLKVEQGKHPSGETL